MLDDLARDIKFNCDVSDAGYWGYFSICGLLLRYRDLYRSERGLKPWSDIKREEIASWISAKEARWPDLERQGFRDLTIDGKRYGPFAVQEINGALGEQGLVYGAGYGMYMKPTFFLAELKAARTIEGFTVFTSGREIVRDLFTSAGMFQERSIFLRLDPLQSLLAFKLSEMKMSARRISAAQDAFAQYGLSGGGIIDPVFERRIEDVAARYAEVILLHELAEAREAIPEWKELLAAAGDRMGELFLRAVKDLIADTAERGPLKSIIDLRDQGALSLLFGLMDGYTRSLSPELRNGYDKFLQTRDWETLDEIRIKSYRRFTALREKILELYRANSQAGFGKQLGDLILTVI